MAGNLSVINGQLYTVDNAMAGLRGQFGMPTFPTSGNIKPDYLEYMVKNKWVAPYQMQPQTAAKPSQPQAMAGKVPAELGNYLNRLSLNASDALYGGLLGYQQKPITSPTGNQYAPPSGQGFQFPFGLLGQGMQQGGLMTPSWRQGGM